MLLLLLGGPAVSVALAGVAAGCVNRRFCLVLNSQRVEHAHGDPALIGDEVPQRLEFELERLIGAAFGVPKDQLIQLTLNVSAMRLSASSEGWEAPAY